VHSRFNVALVGALLLSSHTPNCINIMATVTMLKP